MQGDFTFCEQPSFLVCERVRSDVDDSEIIWSHFLLCGIKLAVGFRRESLVGLFKQLYSCVLFGTLVFPKRQVHKRVLEA